MPAKDAVEKARGQVAGLLGCDPTEVVFTSGGSESNNHAIKGVFFANRDRGDHIITTAVEHPATINPCRFLETLGAKVTVLPVDRFGMVDPDDVRKAITPKTILITVMHANNEVGTIEPIPEIAAIAREAGIPFHTDAAQTVGKISADVEELGVDLLSVAGHKVYAPKGIGALYIREGTKIEPFVHGAGHEAGRRAGTENVLLCRGAWRGMRCWRGSGSGCRRSGPCATVSGRGSKGFSVKGDAQRPPDGTASRTPSTSTSWAGSARRSSRCFPGSPHRPVRPATPVR